MLGVFNSFNFNVYRGSDFSDLYTQANIPYNELDYGKRIRESHNPPSIYMDLIYNSFGQPSFIIDNVTDGPVDCWIVSSLNKRQIIYIEYWKCAYPQRMYIFFNKSDEITSMFLKSLYESVK